VTRRRAIGWSIAGVSLVVLLVVGYVVAENVARDYARDRIHDELAKALSLEAEHPMRIDLGGGSFLLQAAAGVIDDVHVDIDAVPLGDIEGSLAIEAAGIPLDGTSPVDALTATATVDAANVQKLRSYISGIDLDSLTLGNGVVDVSTTITALFLTVPVTAGVEPVVADGQLEFTPRTITVNGADVSVDALLAGPLGSVAKDLLPTQSFCVAQYLPRSIVLTGVDVTPKRLRLDFTGDSVVLGTELETLGTCP
jgi:hypothetical protein